MGTDIHGVFQRHDGARWRDVASLYEQARHYQLFAVLAGARNGKGFAGIAIGEVVTPIAEPRGLPPEFEVWKHNDHPIQTLEQMDPLKRKYREKYLEVTAPMEVWMGDHSHSWLTGNEMLAWIESAPEVVKTGILDRKDYEAWDGVTPPESYCGGISGRDVAQINDSAIEKEQRPEWTHIRCCWQSNLRAELGYFFDEVARLVAEHGDIRFVFGFDS